MFRNNSKPATLRRRAEKIAAVLLISCSAIAAAGLQPASAAARSAPGRITGLKVFASAGAWRSHHPDPGATGGHGNGFDHKLRVSFVVPQSSVTEVEYRVGAGKGWHAFAPSTLRSGARATGTIKGLTNGVGYRIALRAVNGTGAGQPSSAAKAEYPYGTPSTPAVSAHSTNGVVKFHWSGHGNGRPIAKYMVALDGASFSSMGDRPATLHTKLGYDKKYSIRAYVVDTAGQRSSTTPKVTGTTGDVPPPPNLGCSASGTTISCSWSGTTGLKYQWSWDNTAEWGTASTATSTSQNFGSSETHTLYVRATDGKGHHSDSASAQATTPGSGQIVMASKGASCSGASCSSQSPSACTSSQCAFIHVKLSGFSGTVSCSFNSSAGSGGFVNESFSGNADKDSWNFFGHPGGWVQVTCGGVASSEYTWP